MLMLWGRSSSCLRVLFLTGLLSCAGMLSRQLSYAAPPIGGMPMLFMGPEGESWRQSLNKLRDPTENLHINAWFVSGMNVKLHSPRTRSILSQPNDFRIQKSYTLKKNVTLYTSM